MNVADEESWTQFEERIVERVLDRIYSDIGRRTIATGWKVGAVVVLWELAKHGFPLLKELLI